MDEIKNKTAMSKRAQDLIDLATGTFGKYKYNETSHFSQDVTVISTKTDNTFIDENGELKRGYYNLRFNYTDRWKSIFMISLVYNEVFEMDEYPGERATYNYRKISDLDGIVNLLREDGYPLDEERIYGKLKN